MKIKILTIMRKLSRLIPLVLLLLISCRNEEELRFIIKGQVTDASINQPMSSGELALYKLPLGNSQPVFVDQLSLTHGQYEFSFLRDKSERYLLRFSNAGYFDEELEINFSDLTVGDPYVINFSVDAIAYAHWVFQNTNSANPNNSVSIQKLNGRTNGAGTCPNQTYTFSGQQTPDTLTCAVGGNKFVRFYIVDLPSFSLDSLYCEAQEDNYYYVNY